LAAAGDDASIRLWDPATGQLHATLLALSESRGVALTSDGHYRGLPRVERELVYVVETDAGQETLTPEEFERKYGWKNDPDKVRLVQ
jgi:hypothetical protein